MGVLFDGGPNEPRDLSEVLGMALGAASMCWDETPKGIFDSTRAKDILDEIQAYVDRHIRENWLNGYMWALQHLSDPGVLADAARYAAAKATAEAMTTQDMVNMTPSIP